MMENQFTLKHQLNFPEVTVGPIKQSKSLFNLIIFISSFLFKLNPPFVCSSLLQLHLHVCCDVSERDVLISALTKIFILLFSLVSSLLPSPPQLLLLLLLLVLLLFLLLILHSLSPVVLSESSEVLRLNNI